MWIPRSTDSSHEVLHPGMMGYKGERCQRRIRQEVVSRKLKVEGGEKESSHAAPPMRRTKVGRQRLQGWGLG
jgi:hypothetical protein